MGNNCGRVKKNENAKARFQKKRKSKKKDILNDDDKNSQISNSNEAQPKENKNEIEEIKIKEEKEEPKKEQKKEKENKKEKEKLIIKEEKQNTSKDVDNFEDDEECTCNLKLEICLKKVISFKKFYVELYEYKNCNKTEKKKISQTDIKSATDQIIKFETDLIIPFYFSQIQPLEFIIKNEKNEKSISIENTLGEIVGGLRQVYKKNIEGDMIFEVKASLNDELNRECEFNVEISGDFIGMKTRYKIISLGNQYEPINKLVYESEIMNNSPKMVFKPMAIPLSELSQDDALEDNMIEISFIDMNHSDELAKFNGSIAQLFENDIDLDLKLNRKAKIICKKKNFFSLLDYLESDMHLNTTLAIDFSETSGTNTHHLVKDETTFENLMNNFINLLEPYNEDEYFYIYGYGFQLKNDSKEVQNMFPITQDIDRPSVAKKNINSTYCRFLEDIKFSKIKTNLDLIIKQFNEKIKEDIDDYDIREYNVLLLFANNDINNEKEFYNEFILSSDLPISLVIIGLGKGPFTKLENVEKNFWNITDNSGNKAKRKNIKFISFNNLGKNYQRTVKNSLVDIPDQMTEYLILKNIKPSN